MADERLELIHDDAVRTIDHQVAKLDELRGRAATVLQAASIVTAFLGAETYAKDPGALAGLAALAFAVVVGTAVYVLWPRSPWYFSNDARTLLEDVDAGSLPDLDAYRRHVIGFLAGHADSNEEKLLGLTNAVVVGVVALGAEALLLFGALATR